jgi:hypothetical protein
MQITEGNQSRVIESVTANNAKGKEKTGTVRKA